jgi:hypothetical protein
LTVEYAIVALRFAAISVDGVVEVVRGRKLEMQGLPEKGPRLVPRKKSHDKSSPRSVCCPRKRPV